jgi:hypothetical protein
MEPESALTKAVDFFTVASEAIVRRGRVGDYVEAALWVALKIPVSVTTGDASAAFVRWHFREDPRKGDEWMREALSGHKRP